MALSQRLELRQSQSLVMTPQLQQAIKLLQLSNIEVAEYVERELESNPLLEHDQDAAAGAEEAGSGTPDPGADKTEPEADRDTLDLATADTLPDQAEAPLDTDFQDLFDSSPAEEPYANAPAPSGGSGPANGESTGLEQRLSEGLTLRQHLLDQLAVELVDPIERLIGFHLIDMLDEAGYLVGSLQELADLLACSLERVEAALAAVQRFDPSGIFARDLKECLAIQLAERNRLDPAMAVLLDHLDLVAQRDQAKIMKLCRLDAEDVADMVAELRALNPKPALAFDTSPAEAIIPDILMQPRPDGVWHIELNPETLPKVLVNTRYHAEVRSRARTREERDYLTDRLQQANWLVKALHQRATTILKVATEIVRQQSAFFQKGVEHLRPLTLRDVAEQVELHESTVSRVTANKYIATPRGTLELKYFFTAAIAGLGGQEHSAEAVRHRIRQLIDQETAEKVLSDDMIVAILHADGIDIARRTVAKYRDAMRIPSSVQRRRDKRSPNF